MPSDKKAYVEDCPDDEAPTTKAHVQVNLDLQPDVTKSASTSRPSQPKSGPSSDTSNTRRSDAAPPPVRTTSTSKTPQFVPASPKYSSQQSRPSNIHRTSSTRSGHSRTQTDPAPTTCPDSETCNQPDCLGARYKDNTYRPSDIPPVGYFAPSPQKSSYPVQPITAMPTFVPGSMAPPPLPTARPRAYSSSRPVRPSSMYGGIPMIDTNVHGPPLSRSAWHQPYSQSNAGYAGQPYVDQYAGTQQTSPGSTYPINSPTKKPISARGNPKNSMASIGFDIPRPMSVQPSPSNSYTRESYARGSQQSKGKKPAVEYIYDSASESDSEDDRAYERRPRPARRPSRRESRSNSCRPDLTKSYTTDALLRSDNGRRDYQEVVAVRRQPATTRRRLITSERLRADREDISDVARREEHALRRQPSIFSDLDEGRKDAVIEDLHGRIYIAHDEAARLTNQQEVDELARHLRDRHLDDRQHPRYFDAEQYQAQNTGKRTELTAHNIRRASGSHLTGARSHRSIGSRDSQNRGLVLAVNGAFVNVAEGQMVELQGGEEGGPAQVIVTSNASGVNGTVRDSGYHSQSGAGRSRNASNTGASLRDRYKYDDDYPRGNRAA